MKTYKISLDFSPYSDPDLIVKALAIITSMTGNTNYATPVPTIAIVTTSNSTFQTAVSKADIGTQNDRIARDQKRDILVANLVALGLYVQANGKNDPLVLASSGYDLHKDKAPIGVLPKPENVKLKVEIAKATFSLKKIKGANAYLYQYTPAPATDASVWINEIGTAAKMVIDGLESGTQYAFRVCGIGSDPTRIFSDEVSSYIL